MQEPIRLNTYKDIKNNDWKLNSSVKDDDFKPLVNKMIKSNQSYFITGPGGSGKTILLKQLQNKLTATYIVIHWHTIQNTLLYVKLTLLHCWLVLLYTSFTQN